MMLGLRVASFGWLGAVMFMAACAGSGKQPATGSDQEEIAWSSFRWASATIGDTTLERAAVMVPLTADTLGGTYWLQLDTGTPDAIWLYAGPVDDLLGKTGVERDTTAPFVISSGRLGAWELRDTEVAVRGFPDRRVSPGDSTPKIGTLGLGFFRRGALLLDFPAQRFAIIYPATAIPSWIEEQASWIELNHHDGKMFLPLTLGGTPYEDFFFDTGSSALPLLTTLDVWQAATGRRTRDPANTVLTVPSFGEPVTIVGAPATGDLTLGSATLEHPLIFHVRDGPERLRIENWSSGASGVIGNELFADRYLVVIDLPHGRFGLVDRAPPRE